ncbi:MAG: GntR family transcriptional regulator [Victivallaceae bacterium]
MEIDLQSPVPVYLQVADWIKAGCLAGRWRPGDRIPPVREMAALLRINPNTVAKAYKLLQEQTVIEGRHGGGNFIAPRPEAQLAEDRRAFLETELAALLERTDRFGVPHAEVLAKLTELCRRKENA